MAAASSTLRKRSRGIFDSMKSMCSWVIWSKMRVRAAAGDMVIFSSLTPHKTGANVTDGVRKALILQYAADGACRIDTDGRTVPQDDLERNFPILRGGAPVAAR